jgi:YesN/AraC family two-component response regulator
MNILVVDDEPVILRLLQDTLEDAGYSVTTANNGRKATRLIQENSFDLIITDIIMPELEGIGLIRNTQRDFPEIKIIAISGGGLIGPNNYLEVAKSVGASASLLKPVIRSELLATVKKVLSE